MMYTLQSVSYVINNDMMKKIFIMIGQNEKTYKEGTRL